MAEQDKCFVNHVNSQYVFCDSRYDNWICNAPWKQIDFKDNKFT